MDRIVNSVRSFYLKIKLLIKFIKFVPIINLINMKAHVRKISVGNNYPDGAMHYQVGKTIRLQGVPYEIVDILPATEKKYEDKVAFHIFIANDEGKVYWKTVVDMPTIIENNIDFD